MIDMAEYYNKNTPEYRKLLENPHRIYKIRLELLSYNESVIGEITKDLSISASGQITINYNQIVRRTCSLSLINVDSKYIPSVNNLIWFNRKFKIWIGVANLVGDIYWWSYGVFYTQSAKSDKHTLNIEGIDKGGALDGSLKTSMTGAQFIIPPNQPIATCVKDALMLDMSTLVPFDTQVTGACMPIDPIDPIIDTDYNNEYVQSEITIDENNYIADLLVAFAEGYGADVYYNTEGHFVLSHKINVSRSDEYRFVGHQWEYSDIAYLYSDCQVEYKFDGCNVVTVYTNATSEENVSYTAANNNPASPLRVNAVGVRRMESQEMNYVDVSKSEMRSRCKAYADYLLTKESMVGMNVTFSSAIIPHLDVNKTIGLTDSVQGFENETFVVQSITLPLSAGVMSITATNVSWLPNDTNLEGLGD